MGDADDVRFAGVDWASEVHAACVVDAHGLTIEAFDVAHSKADLRSLCDRLVRLGVRRVAIERSDGPVVDALISSGLEIFVVSTRAVKDLRKRYGLAETKTTAATPSSSPILCVPMRTVGVPWNPTPRRPLLSRALVRSRADFVSTRVATANQLRAHLDLVFPGGTALFYELDSAISLRFLGRFPTADKASWLSEKRLAAWLATTGYCGRTSTAVLLRRLQGAPRGLEGPAAIIQSGITLALVEALRVLQQQIEALAIQIKQEMAQHPDAFIFQSLPRAGTVRAATMLAEIGDCRSRFPSHENLARLAGAVRRHARRASIASSRFATPAISSYAAR